jgi:hypothetical protein
LLALEVVGVVVPRYGLNTGPRPAGAVAPVPDLEETVTELRVHGVGGTPPEGLLGDLAPQQVGGDRLAGFYRTADLTPEDTGSTRHVEGYSWGGLTSRSSVRVLWLLLVPFMLANLAGWMYRGPKDSDGTPSGFRFGLHRVAANLACLALTVNTVLVAVMIGPDLIAYQATRANLAGHWWLWPLSWTWVRGHQERPLVIGYAAVAVAVGVLVLLAVRTQGRYESVVPPWRLDEDAPAKTTPDTKVGDRPKASAADTVLTERDFWNSAVAVRRMTGAHVGAAVGFLAVTFAVTAKASAGAEPAGLVWWWVAVIAGGAALAMSTAVVAGDRWIGGIGMRPFSGGVTRVLAHAVAPAGLVSAGVFAFQQREMSTGAGSLPGLNGISAATYLALGASIALVIVAGLLGKGPARGDGKGFAGAPALVMILAAGLLNAILLSALFTVGHALGPLHAESAPPPTVLNLPVPLAWAGPLLAAALVVAIICAALWQLLRIAFFVRDPRDFTKDEADYRASVSDPVPAAGTPDADWAVTMVEPAGEQAKPHQDLQAERESWRRRVRRTHLAGEVRSAAKALIWLIAVFQAGGILLIVVFRPPVPDAWYSPDGALGKAVVFAWGASLVGLMWLLRRGWHDPARRKQIGVLWDVGTFWPRSYHPLAPPCYAERAVPDIQRRIWRLNDHHAPVVLVGHSQGAVLAGAALLPARCRAKAGTIALVTFGNPVSWLYAWAFPGWISSAVLAKIVGRQQGHAQVVTWSNYYYPTDPIGSDVDRGEPAKPEERLADPESAWHIYGDPPPAPGGHSGYWSDPRVWSTVDKIADGIAPPAPAVKVVVRPEDAEIRSLPDGQAPVPSSDDTP